MQKTTPITNGLEPMHYLLLATFFMMLAYCITYVEVRTNAIRAFNRRNHIDFYTAVNLNDQLPPTSKTSIGIIDDTKYPTFFNLFFSSKPLDRKLWFTQSELNLFFNPKTVTG